MRRISQDALAALEHDGHATDDQAAALDNLRTDVQVQNKTAYKLVHRWLESYLLATSVFDIDSDWCSVSDIAQTAFLRSDGLEAEVGFLLNTWCQNANVGISVQIGIFQPKRY